MTMNTQLTVPTPEFDVLFDETDASIDPTPEFVVDILLSSVSRSGRVS